MDAEDDGHVVDGGGLGLGLVIEAVSCSDCPVVGNLRKMKMKSSLKRMKRILRRMMKIQIRMIRIVRRFLRIPQRSMQILQRRILRRIMKKQ